MGAGPLSSSDSDITCLWIIHLWQLHPHYHVSFTAVLRMIYHPNNIGKPVVLQWALYIDGWGRGGLINCALAVCYYKATKCPNKSGVSDRMLIV